MAERTKPLSAGGIKLPDTSPSTMEPGAAEELRRPLLDSFAMPALGDHLDSTSRALEETPLAEKHAFTSDYWLAVDIFREKLPELLSTHFGKWAGVDKKQIFCIGPDDRYVSKVCKDENRPPGSYAICCIIPETEEIVENSNWLP